MNKALYNIGISAAFVGILSLGAGVVAGLWFWYTEIVPFFLEQGNYWPGVIPVALALLVVGSILIEANKEPAN